MQTIWMVIEYFLLGRENAFRFQTDSTYDYTVNLFFLAGKSHHKSSSSSSSSAAGGGNNANKEPHIKKPLNAFMLYMKEMRPVVQV